MENIILVVAEKKTLAEAVANVLPGTAEHNWDQKGITHNTVGKYVFVWLDGHAYEQAMPDYYLPSDVPKTAKGKKIWRKTDLPIIPSKWTLLPKESKLRRLDKLSELLKKCDVVWHLGDPDEEGQLLVDEALEFNGYKGTVKRILVNDYNKNKVQQAIDGIRDNNEPLFRGWHKWALARGRYDWLLGLNGTRAMTLRGRELGFDGLLPVGSVQTPLLYIIRERDRIIETFKSIPYYSLSARIRHANGTFLTHWKAQAEHSGLDESGRLIDLTIANDLVAQLTGKPVTIIDYTKQPKEKRAPLLLAMDELQMEAFSKYGYDGQTVLDAAQTLYEKYKVTSYPRSTNRYVSEAQHAEANTVIDAIFKVRPDLSGLATELDSSRKSDSFNDKKMEGNPHHGIVPAIPESTQNPATWSEAERNIYDLVVRSYLAQFAANYEYLATSIEVDIDNERFVTNGSTPVAQGWKIIYSEAEDDDHKDNNEDIEQQTLPMMNIGDPASCEKCEYKSKKTSPPPRFDDKLITDALKNVYKYVTDEVSKKRLKEGDGIGTSATRAPMVLDMKERGLLIPAEKGKLKVMTSPEARALIDALPLEVKDPAQAGVFKSSLDRVSKGELSYENFMAETEVWVSNIVALARDVEMTFPSSGEPCPACGKPLRRISGKSGHFWGCSGYPACSTSLADEKGKPVIHKPAEVSEHLCKKCNKPLIHRVKSGKGGYDFWGCSGYKDGCKESYNSKNGKPDYGK